MKKNVHAKNLIVKIMESAVNALNITEKMEISLLA